MCDGAFVFGSDVVATQEANEVIVVMNVSQLNMTSSPHLLRQGGPSDSLVIRVEYCLSI